MGGRFELLSTFCSMTPLHGILYLAEPRHRSEVLFWAVVLVFCACCSAYIMALFVKEHPLETVVRSKRKKSLSSRLKSEGESDALIARLPPQPRVDNIYL